MVKARKDNNVILGLSEENVKRLKDGKPIRFNMKELGFDDIWIYIFTGKTEESMALILKKMTEPDN
jgi:hypothetical protein